MPRIQISVGLTRRWREGIKHQKKKSFFCISLPLFHPVLFYIILKTPWQVEYQENLLLYIYYRFTDWTERTKSSEIIPNQIQSEVESASNIVRKTVSQSTPLSISLSLSSWHSRYCDLDGQNDRNLLSYIERERQKSDSILYHLYLQFYNFITLFLYFF